MLFLSWNCGNGLNSKIDAVRYLIEKSNPDALFIHEAEAKIGQLSYFQIKNYDLVPANSINGPHQMARTVCYIKNSSPLKVIQTNDSNADIIMLEMGKIAFAGLYRGFKLPPNTLPQSYFESYLRILDTIVSNMKFTEIFIMGDFNIDPQRDMKKWNGKMLEEWSTEHCLTQHIKGTTRQRDILMASGKYTRQKSLIDLVYSRNVLPGVNFNKTSDYGSDHVCLQINLQIKQEIATRKIFIRDATKLTEANILREAFKVNTPINTLHHLNEVHHNILEKLAPTRTVRLRDPSNIVNPRIEKVKKKRDRLYRKYKKTGNPALLTSVKLESRRLKNVIKKEA